MAVEEVGDRIKFVGRTGRTCRRATVGGGQREGCLGWTRHDSRTVRLWSQDCHREERVEKGIGPGKDRSYFRSRESSVSSTRRQTGLEGDREIGSWSVLP